MMTLVAASVANASVFCKLGQKTLVQVLDVEHKDHLMCMDAVYIGQACFIGNAQVSKEFLNSEALENSYIERGSGEFVTEAKNAGHDKIEYTSIDLANNHTSYYTITRCPSRD